MIDGGGGNTILRQLKYAGIDWKSIKNIFVTHKHIDHITGILWMIRMICQYMSEEEYEGEATIYAHDEVIQYAENSKWLLHEAFCMDSQTELFHPYEKHHSTVKDLS